MGREWERGRGGGEKEGERGRDGERGGKRERGRGERE